MRTYRRLPLFALIASIAAGAASATQVRRMNLEDLSSRAQRIIAGRCTSVETVQSLDIGLPVRVVTIDVDRTVKGPRQSTIVFRIVAGVPGMPEPQAGEDLVLFLHGESGRGLTSPVGLGQGAFAVVRDKTGRTIAVNRVGNRGLLDHLSPAARARLGERLLAVERAGRTSPTDLLDMVETMLPPGP